MGGPSPERGLRDPISIQGSSLTCSPGVSSLPGKRGKTSSPERNSLLKGETGHRGGSGSKSRLLQQVVPGQESVGGLEASFGCLMPRQVCQKDQVFDGIIQDRSVSHSTGGLDDFNRHAGCLFPYSHSPVQSEVPEVLLRGENLSVPCNVFRPEHSASGLHEGSGPSSETNPSGRLQDAFVSRRLVDPGQDFRRDDEGKSVHPKPRKRVRFSHQLWQIKLITSTEDCLSRNDDKLNPLIGFSNPKAS